MTPIMSEIYKTMLILDKEQGYTNLSRIRNELGKYTEGEVEQGVKELKNLGMIKQKRSGCSVYEIA